MQTQLSQYPKHLKDAMDTIRSVDLEKDQIPSLTKKYFVITKYIAKMIEKEERSQAMLARARVHPADWHNVNGDWLVGLLSVMRMDMIEAVKRRKEILLDQQISESRHSDGNSDDEVHKRIMNCNDKIEILISKLKDFKGKDPIFFPYTKFKLDDILEYYQSECFDKYDLSDDDGELCPSNQERLKGWTKEYMKVMDNGYHVRDLFARLKHQPDQMKDFVFMKEEKTNFEFDPNLPFYQDPIQDKDEVMTDERTELTEEEKDYFENLLKDNLNIT